MIAISKYRNQTDWLLGARVIGSVTSESLSSREAVFHSGLAWAILYVSEDTHRNYDLSTLAIAGYRLARMSSRIGKNGSGRALFKGQGRSV